MQREEMNKSFKNYMTEKKVLDRWTVLLIGIIGAFAGALITVVWMMMGFAR